MCQLTLIDFNDPRFARFVVRPLTEINTIGIGGMSNHDGFGYVCFTNPENINKSNETAVTWWEENKKDFKKKHKNPNGIYHVRACSVTQRDKKDDEHSHPFFTDDIVLAHNGTLHRRMNTDNADFIKENILDDDLIDSENFLRVLDYYIGEDNSHPHLVAENIQSAVDEFSGQFAFLMIDKRNPNSIFIAKDDEKKLQKAEFKIGKKKAGIIINTMPFELRFIANMLVAYAEAFEIKLTYEMIELEDMSVYIYQRSSYTLDDPMFELERNIPKTITHPTIHSNRSPIRESSTGNKAPFERAANMIFSLQMNYIEVVALTEILFGQNFFTFNEDMMNAFADFLEAAEDQYNYKGRRKTWMNLRSEIGIVKSYSEGKIKFPYFLNSNKQLKRVKRVVKNA